MVLENAMAAAHKATHLGSRRKSSMRLNATLFATVILTLAGSAVGARAQAKPGASRSAEISAYGGFSYEKPDFGAANQNNTGGMIGVNYTRFINFMLQPSLELRANYGTGDIITEKSVTGGFRGTYDFVDKYDFRDRLHPYIFVHGGAGTLRYNHYLGIPSDRGFILAGGIGLNVDAYKHFQIMADAELQNWNLGQNAYLKPSGDTYTLSPKIFTLGISYRVPARSRSRIADTK